MHQPHADPAADLARRFGAFVLERHPFGAAVAIEAFTTSGGPQAATPDEIEQVRGTLPGALRARTQSLGPSIPHDTTPGISGIVRLAAAVDELIDACDGFLRRAAIRRAPRRLTRAARRWLSPGSQRRLARLARQ